MEYLIEIPGGKVEAARAALEKAGVAFDPEKQAAVVQKESTGFGEVILGSDAPVLVEAINGHLSEKGLEPRVPEGKLTLEQRLELMTLGWYRFGWDECRVKDLYCGKTGDDWRAVAREYPALFGKSPEDSA